MILTACLLALCGCSNNEFKQDPFNEGMKTITSFTAILDDNADTRLHIIDGTQGGDKRMGWQWGDDIEVYSDQDTETHIFNVNSIDESETMAKFSGDAVTGNTFYAFFPEGSTRTAYEMINVDENNPMLLRVNYDNTYTAHPFPDEDFFTYAPLVAVSDGASFEFRQTTGLLHFAVSGLDVIGRVVLRGNNNEPLLGQGYIDLSEKEPVLFIEEGETMMELQNVTSGSDVIHIYFCIPPITFTKGITLEIWPEMYAEKHIVKTLSEPMTVGRAQVKTFPVINADEIDNDTNPYTDIEFNNNDITLNIGESSQVIAYGMPDGVILDNVVWSSSDPSVAIVDENGIITGVNDGKTSILATYSDIINSVSVRVKFPTVDPNPSVIHVESISFDVTSVSLEPGGSSALTLSFNPSDAENQKYTVECSDTSVVTLLDIDRIDDGKYCFLITAVNTGDATITANSEDGQHTASVKVKVEEEFVDILTVDFTTELPQKINVCKNQTYQLPQAIFYPENATNRSACKWVSSDTTVFSVDDNRLLTPVSVSSKYSYAYFVDTNTGNKYATVRVYVEDRIASDANEIEGYERQGQDW